MKSAGKFTNRISLLSGPIACVVVILVSSYLGLENRVAYVLGMSMLMASWWITEAIPLAATSMIPIVFLPLFGLASSGDALAPYASNIVFLMLGAFLLSAAVERCELHRRIALSILNMFGQDQRSTLFAFLIATAILSMWISNSAAAAIMVPVVLSTAESVDQSAKRETQQRYLLAVAWAATIGGMATPVGTPPNLVLLAYLKSIMEIEITFLNWMFIATPISVFLLVVAWFILSADIESKPICVESPTNLKLKSPGKMSGRLTRDQRRVLYIFVFTITMWISRPYLQNVCGLNNLSDGAIVIAMAILLYIIPSESMDHDRKSRLIRWDQMSHISWDTLILVGGGLALATAISMSGLSSVVEHSFNIQVSTAQSLWFLFSLVLAVSLITEVTSNTATISFLLPIIAVLSAVDHASPPSLLIAATLASSCAFMLPVATGPNAIVYASGVIDRSTMIRFGFRMNVCAVAFLSIFVSIFIS